MMWRTMRIEVTQMDRYFVNIFKLGESICIQLVERLSELIQHDVVGSVLLVRELCP